MADILREQLYYLPVYLIDDKQPDASGWCSLFVRRLRLVQTSKTVRIRCASDVWFFPNEDSMIDAIEQYEMRELPPEADADHTYVPGDFVVPGVRAEREYGVRIVAPLPEPL